MADSVKIAVIGDFNFTYNTHHATNMSLEHSENLLEIEVNSYWIRINEAAKMKAHQFQEYDALWIAPGPFENVFYLGGVLDSIMDLDIPVLITGESFKIFIEVLISKHNLNPNIEKLISDNLIEGSQFENIEVQPASSALTKMYQSHSKHELSSSRYSLYPKLISYLQDDIMDIEAYNQYEDPEIVSLKKRDFFVGCMFCPQISSTREMPHPLISSFLTIAIAKNKAKQTA